MYVPLFRHRPRHKWTNGDLAARVAEDLGLPPDDEQRWIYDTTFAEVAPDRPASFEVGVISPRQNIKTSSFGVAAIADLFVFGVERHLWTAHHGDTLKGTFNDFRAWIKSNPEYDEQVTFYEGHQDMSIVHKDTGNMIDFQSRTGKAGRGLTGVKRITLDEALYLEPKHVGAVYPTMLTRPGAQVRIASSAGLVTSEQLRRIRDRGRPGKDARMSWVEYGAEQKPCLRTDCTHAVGAEGCALDDRDLWWQANPALWSGRITEAALEDQRNSLPPEEFMREFLSWWDDPVSLGGVFPMDLWNGQRVDAPADDPVAFGLDMTWDREWADIGWSTGSYVDLHRHARGSGWVVEECKALQAKYPNAAVWTDPKGPAATLIQALRDAGVRVEEIPFDEYKRACGAFYDAVTQRDLTHSGHPALDAAVSGAVVTGGSGGWVWDRKKGAVISPLVAVTHARHGATSNDEPRIRSL